MLVPVAGAVLLTGSRAAAVGAGVGMLLLFLLSYRFTAASTVRLVVGAGLAAGAGWLILSRLPAWTVDRILHNSYADDSNLRRLELWRTALEGFLARPFTGHGVGNFVANPEETYLGIDPVTSHSTYLSVLVDGGVGYLVVIAVVLGSACVAVVRARRELVGLVACFAVVTMIVDASRMAFFWYGLVMLTVIGAVLAAERETGHAAPEPGRRDAAAPEPGRRDDAPEPGRRDAAPTSGRRDDAGDARPEAVAAGRQP